MNYIGSHNLNLIGKVALVLGASSQTGAAICRALLNSNAFVLGIDSDKAHDSTRSARGSHFQFLKSGDKDGRDVDWKAAIEYSEKMFWKEEVDVLILVVDEKRRLEMGGLDVVIDRMQQRGSGIALVVSGSAAVRGVDVTSKLVRELRGILSGKRVRYNAVLPAGSFPMKGEIPSLAEMQDHIAEHTTKRKEGGYQLEYAREVANVALFLCTELGNGIDGIIVGSDGSCGSLENESGFIKLN